MQLYHVSESCGFRENSEFIYLFIYLLFSHNKDYTSITLYKDVARGPQKTTRLVRGGPLVTIILSNRTITTHNKLLVFSRLGEQKNL